MDTFALKQSSVNNFAFKAALLAASCKPVFAFNNYHLSVSFPGGFRHSTLSELKKNEHTHTHNAPEGPPTPPPTQQQRRCLFPSYPLETSADDLLTLRSALSLIHSEHHPLILHPSEIQSSSRPPVLCEVLRHRASRSHHVCREWPGSTQQ